MIHSMTGFASRIISLPIGIHITTSVTLTLKTVNGRFFEVTCKMPSSCAIIESDIVQRCRTRLQRGSIMFSLQSMHPFAFKSGITPSYALAEGYVAAAHELQKNLGLPGEVSIRDILLLPHIFESGDTRLPQEICDLILRETDLLIEEVMRVRAREGESLYQDIMHNIANIEHAIEHLIPRATEASEQRLTHIVKLLQEPLDTLPEETRSLHLQAIYQNVSKIEINEEFVRLKTHIAALKETLGCSQEPQGKKLDFILQEMFREINTLSAKLVDALAFEHIIAIKTALERMREQAQNIV